MAGIKIEGESDFTPGPDCSFPGMCRRGCLGAQTIDQGITDDQSGVETGNLTNIVRRISCNNQQAVNARVRASEYIEGKK